MTFSALWPLIFIISVPLVIIIYMLRPKGKKSVVPSLMLWKDAEVNMSSMSLIKRLLRNILMVLEIAAAILIILALMSPFIRTGFGKHRGSTVLVLDVSGSMKSVTSSDADETRFEKAISEMLDIAGTLDDEISVITSVEGTVNLITAASTDKIRTIRAIKGIECTDAVTDFAAAESTIASLQAENIIVFTDGEGADKASHLAEDLGAEIRVMGSAVQNVAITGLSTGRAADGTINVAADLRAFGGDAAAADISLYDAADRLLAVRNISLDSEGTKTILFRELSLSGGYVRAELSGMTEDGINEDNIAYAVTDERASVDCYLVGKGNTFIETAYRAATGKEIIRIESDSLLPEEGKYIVIYDSGVSVSDDTKAEGVLILDGGRADDVANTGFVDVPTGELTRELSSFSFGAGDVTEAAVPEWGNSFMNLGDSPAGYYGIEDGKRKVVLLFDIRNSEFPLMPEFPVFIANVLDFLSDESFILNNYTTAGMIPEISPTAGDMTDISYITGETLGRRQSATEAGLISVTADERTEYISVRFPAAEMDSSKTAESIMQDTKRPSGISMTGLRRICIIIAIIILLIDWFIYVRRSRGWRREALTVRAVLLLLLILAAVGIGIPGRRSKTVTIFVVDMSDSTRELTEEMEEYLKDKLSDMPSKNEYAILTFGRNSMSEQFLTENNDFIAIGTRPDGTATDIESAVRSAAALIPDSYSGRIVILTDGRETLGDISATRELIESSGIELDSVLFEAPFKKDVYVSAADMPETLYPNDRYSLVVSIYSSYDIEAAHVQVRSGSTVKAESVVNLKTGNNTIMLSLIAGEDAIEANDIIVMAEGDEVPENDIYSTAANIIASPRVLLVSGLSEDSSGLGRLLTEINQDVRTVSVLNAPCQLEEMLTYKTIILDNCYKDDIPEGMLNNLDTYIKDYGGGLIVCGGNESFAPGGYRGSVLENVLPVNMMPKGINEAPSMAMVMVIDNSGSMNSPSSVDPSTGEATGRSKLALAIAAATGAVNNLTGQDYVGVLTFDDKYEWRQEITGITDDKEDIIEAIASIPAGGGTVIKPALLEAVNEISKVDAGIKHIVLLTDGEGETTDFDDAIQKINSEGITLSTIAVGGDSARNLLQHLAESCGGRYYYSESAGNIPKIFAEEVYLSGDTYFQEGEFALSMKQSSDIIKGLYQDGVPHVTGYIAASAKMSATELISSDKGDPILTIWQYGLGKTVAWNTTASGTWNEELVESPDYPEMWRRVLDTTVGGKRASDDTVRVETIKEKLKITYTTGDFSEDTGITGVYTLPSGETAEIPFTSYGPGKYVAEVDSADQGIYNINVRRSEAGEVVSSENTIASVHFSDEYRQISNEEYISFINENGRILTVGDKVFGKTRVKRNGRRDITNLLLMTSIAMLLFDIIVRRFGLRIPERRESKKTENLEKTEKLVAKEKADIPEKMEEVDSIKPKNKKSVKKKKKKYGQTEAAVLDTTALLQKKKDREGYE